MMKILNISRWPLAISLSAMSIKTSLPLSKRPQLLFLAGCTLLSSLVQDAHAGTWSAPTYVITDRIAINDSDTITPNGAGTGRAPNNPNQLIPQGFWAAGTVTATFTWIVDNGNTLATDPPPQSGVSVLESGYATWIAREIAPTPDQAAMQSDSRRRRSLMMWTPLPTGVADNGFGDPCLSDHPDGKSGVSQGSRVFVYYPVTGSDGVARITVTSRRLYARVTDAGGARDGHVLTMWGYSAQINN